MDPRDGSAAGCCYTSDVTLIYPRMQVIGADFATQLGFLGNMGTVSLPITAAIAKERDFLLPGDIVGFLGIGSGLNCLMLAIQW